MREVWPPKVGVKFLRGPFLAISPPTIALPGLSYGRLGCMILGILNYYINTANPSRKKERERENLPLPASNPVCLQSTGFGVTLVPHRF